MAKANNNKPFAVKGIRITSPRGEAKWCKVVEPDYQYNAKGIFSTDLVCDPDDAAVKAFIDKLEALQNQAFEETKEALGAAKSKGLQLAPLFKEEFDQNDEETGNIIFKFKMSNVDDKTPPHNKIKVVDGNVKPITDVPLVGNGSTIKCVAFANPYYMASTKTVGISLLWESMQLIKLNSYGGATDGFEVEDDADVIDTGNSNNDDFTSEDDAVDY